MITPDLLAQLRFWLPRIVLEEQADAQLPVERWRARRDRPSSGSSDRWSYQRTRGASRYLQIGVSNQERLISQAAGTRPLGSALSPSR